MDKLAYEQRVQQMAEVLHNKYWEYDGEEVPEMGTEDDSPELYDQARAAVGKQSEAIREFIPHAGNGWWQQPGRIDQYLIENGYVPATEANKCGICGGEYKIINCVSFCKKCGRERN